MRKFYLFLVAIVFVACTDNNDVENSTLLETTICKADISSMSKNEIDALKFVALTGNTKIPVKEAVNLAMQTANEMRCEEGIATKAPLKIKNVAIIKNGVKETYIKTKGVPEKKADLYIINFEDNQGYVLTSGDRRVPGVFAYNSTGNLGDTIYNPGEQVLLGRVENYMKLKKEEFKANRLKLAIAAQEELFKKLSKERQQELIDKGLFDENGKRIVTKFNDGENGDDTGDDCFELPGDEEVEEEEISEISEYPIYELSPWEIVYLQNPLIKTLWRQGGLYNDLLPESNCSYHDSQAPVGCVAVAVGQIMAYHQKLSFFAGRTMHWDKMTKVKGDNMFSNIYDRDSIGKADIQHLLAKLGLPEFLDMEYDCDGSGASNSNALKTFYKVGYDHPIIKKYNSNIVVSEIKAKRPVYITGYSIKEQNVYTQGHAWVIDGYVNREQAVKVTDYNKCTGEEYFYYYYNTVALFHCNFGWGGTLDGNDLQSGTGWYHRGLFDTNNKPDEESNTYKTGTEKNYQYKNRIIIHIK